LPSFLVLKSKEGPGSVGPYDLFLLCTWKTKEESEGRASSFAA